MVFTLLFIPFLNIQVYPYSGFHIELLDLFSLKKKTRFIILMNLINPLMT